MTLDEAKALEPGAWIRCTQDGRPNLAKFVALTKGDSLQVCMPPSFGTGLWSPPKWWNQCDPDPEEKLQWLEDCVKVALLEEGRHLKEAEDLSDAVETYLDFGNEDPDCWPALKRGLYKAFMKYRCATI